MSDRWEKRARELLPDTCDPSGCGPFCLPHTTEGARAMMLLIGREMADARTEEIAKAIERVYEGGNSTCAKLARSFISKADDRNVETHPNDFDVLLQARYAKLTPAGENWMKHKKALREIAEQAEAYVASNPSLGKCEFQPDAPRSIARRALEWKEGEKRCKCDPPPTVVYQTIPPTCPKCGGTTK